MISFVPITILIPPCVCPVKPDKSLSCKIIFKLLQWDLKYDRLITKRCLDRMYLIGIDDQKFSCLQRIFHLINIERKTPLHYRKNLYGRVPVFFSDIISVSAFKKKKFKRKSLIGNDQFMLKLHTHPPFLFFVELSVHGGQGFRKKLPGSAGIKYRS